MILTYGCVLGVVSSPVYACKYTGYPKNREHCCALARWEEENLGTKIELRTFFASVPNPSEEAVNNEQWDGFYPEGWVEAGDKAGVNDYGETTNGLVYFTAVSYPPGGSLEGYYEAALSYGPGADNWFEDDIHAAGSGVWSIFSPAATSGTGEACLERPSKPKPGWRPRTRASSPLVK